MANQRAAPSPHDFPEGIGMNTTTKCPHCGLPLTIVRDQGGHSQLRYDADEWRRRCKRLDLASPALCLVEPAARVDQSTTSDERGSADRPRRAVAVGPAH